MTRRILLLPILLALAGCPDDYCTKVCKRVAYCKEESTKSPERVLGEKEPPANRRCMERCRSESEAFENCEARKRTCSDLTDCLGDNFDN